MYCPIRGNSCYGKECIFFNWRTNEKQGCLLTTAVQNYNYKCYQERKQAMKDYYEAKGEWDNLPL